MLHNEQNDRDLLNLWMLTDERGKLLDYSMNYKVICPKTLEIQVWANLADIKQNCQIIYDLYLSHKQQREKNSLQGL